MLQALNFFTATTRNYNLKSLRTTDLGCANSILMNIIVEVARLITYGYLQIKVFCILEILFLQHAGLILFKTLEFLPIFRKLTNFMY